MPWTQQEKIHRKQKKKINEEKWTSWNYESRNERVEKPEGKEGVQVRKDIDVFEDPRVLWECRNLNPSLRFRSALLSPSLGLC